MRSFAGTATSASRLSAVMVGSIMIDSTITAGNMPGPAERRAEERDQAEAARAASRRAGRSAGITTKMPHRP